MSQSRSKSAASANPILAALSERTRPQEVLDEVRSLREQNARLATIDRAAIRERYAGGLPAEAQSAEILESQARVEAANLRKRVRMAVLGRRGRRIDLAAIMRQRRPDGRPAWAIVDPTHPISATVTYASDGNHYVHPANGEIGSSGDVAWPAIIRGEKIHYNRWTVRDRRVPGLAGPELASGFLPTGLPALPDRVRELVRDPNVIRRANRIGVLYQPEAWVEVNPDPALVVEWTDRPGEYYALAVWGVDGPAIMEFVD